jgi:hypothetical protein
MPVELKIRRRFLGLESRAKGHIYKLRPLFTHKHLSKSERACWLHLVALKRGFSMLKPGSNSIDSMR